MKYRLTLHPRDNGTFFVYSWSDSIDPDRLSKYWPHIPMSPVLKLTMQGKKITTIGNVTCVPVVKNNEVIEIAYFEHLEEN